MIAVRNQGKREFTEEDGLLASGEAGVQLTWMDAKVGDWTREGRQTALHRLAASHEHLRDAGLGQVSEIFDGDAPHHPRGCIAQAWSVAELLRAVVEEGLGMAVIA